MLRMVPQRDAVMLPRGWRSSLRRTDASWNSDLQELWRPFVNSKTPLLVGVGNPLFEQFENKSVNRDPASFFSEDGKASVLISFAVI